MIIPFKKGSNTLRLICKSQALMRFVKWISFNSCGIQISSFLTSRTYIRVIYVVYDGRLFILVFLTFLQSLTQLHDDPIQLWLWYGHQLHLVDLNVAHLWVKSPQSGITNQFWHSLSFKASSPYTSRIFLAALYISFTEIKKKNMTKMLVFTLHLKVDAKLTTVNVITRNLFVK